WERTNDRPGYRHSVTAVGRQLGGSLLGGSLYELPPGEKTWPYHYEQGCEEWLLVVSGHPTLRSPSGEQQLEPGDLAVFPEGPEGGAPRRQSHRRDLPRPPPLLEVAARRRPLPGQRQGRDLGPG